MPSNEFGRSAMNADAQEMMGLHMGGSTSMSNFATRQLPKLVEFPQEITWTPSVMPESETEREASAARSLLMLAGVQRREENDRRAVLHALHAISGTSLRYKGKGGRETKTARRTTSPEQMKILREAFRLNRYPTYEQRLQLLRAVNCFEPSRTLCQIEKIFDNMRNRKDFKISVEVSNSLAPDAAESIADMEIL